MTPSFLINSCIPGTQNSGTIEDFRRWAKPRFLINPRSLSHLSFEDGDEMKLKITVNNSDEYFEGKYSADFSVAEGVIAIAQGHPDQNNFFPPNQLVRIVIDQG